MFPNCFMEDFVLEIHGYVYKIQGENQEYRYSNECNCSYYGLGPQLLEGGDAWKEGDDFFQRGGGCNFHIKNKWKSEIFNDKKSL